MGAMRLPSAGWVSTQLHCSKAAAATRMALQTCTATATAGDSEQTARYTVVLLMCTPWLQDCCRSPLFTPAHLISFLEPEKHGIAVLCHPVHVQLGG